MSEPTTASPSGTMPPQRWWQWFLIYPTVLIALITAVPEWLKIAEAWREDIPTEQLEEAKRQHELWVRNLTCTMRPMDLFLNPSNIKVDAEICDSGDVFVRIFTPDERGLFHWVDVERLATSDLAGPFRTAGTSSGETARATERGSVAHVMCQRFVDNRLLLRVISVDGVCFDETVDTYTGQVTARVEAQCREAC
jgi:hypothetical protein